MARRGQNNNHWRVSGPSLTERTNENHRAWLERRWRRESPVATSTQSSPSRVWRRRRLLECFFAASQRINIQTKTEGRKLSRRRGELEFQPSGARSSVSVNVMLDGRLAGLFALFERQTLMMVMMIKFKDEARQKEARRSEHSGRA